MRIWFALLLAVLLALAIFAFTMPYSPGYRRRPRHCRDCEHTRPCWRHLWLEYEMISSE